LNFPIVRETQIQYKNGAQSKGGGAALECFNLMDLQCWWVVSSEDGLSDKAAKDWDHV